MEVAKIFIIIYASTMVKIAKLGSIFDYQIAKYMENGSPFKKINITDITHYLGILDYFSIFKSLWAQSFTSLKADLCQDINGGFAFSRCLNGIFP